MKTKAQELTLSEILELNILNTQLFKGDMFMVFTQNEENSTTYKRHEELVRKKQAYLKSLS